jgi:hypothetical protein
MPAEQETNIPIQLPPEVQRGVYANQLISSHTQEEFMLDFIFASQQGGSVNARVVVTPRNAKRFMQALAENIRNYENHFGTIEDTATINKPTGPLM